MAEEEHTCEECEEGAPAWVMTFADLMSLLMCFFVLLLAFSEMDVQKFKQVAGSLKFAFGVQRKIKAEDIPKGTSIVAQEFSPGKPVPTPFAIIQQVSTDENKQNLDFTDSTDKNKQQAEIDDANLREKADQLAQALHEEIKNELIEIEAEEDRLVIRVREKGSFGSGQAALQQQFLPVLDRISMALQAIPGQIIVGGHTDNIPIATTRYPSNWVLAAARASAVVHYLTRHAGLNSERIELRAFAENKPVATNQSGDGRSQNRRVEIAVFDPDYTENIQGHMSANGDFDDG